MAADQPYDADGMLEDMASAIGHVVLSHNSMQLALEQVATMVWDEHDDIEIKRLFGRRSVDERLKLMAQQLNSNRRLSKQQADHLDRLLNKCRHLNNERNLLVHSLNSLSIQPSHAQAFISPAETDFDFDEALQLSDELDAVASALLAMCV